ncbi:MAG: hypothetical protein DIJKHBIC_00822 [Thermoanaerobaculia bacterium]|nr:hypothetical protein [Thermoanaerobaculia bacterium]
MKRISLATAGALLLGVPLFLNSTPKASEYGAAVKAYEKTRTETSRNMAIASKEAAKIIENAAPGDTSVVSETGDQLVERHRAELERLRGSVEDVRIRGEETLKAARIQLGTIKDPVTNNRVKSEIAVFERRLHLFLKQADGRMNAADGAIRAARERIVAAALIRNLAGMSAEIASAEKQFATCQDAITAMASIQLPEPIRT